MFQTGWTTNKTVLDSADAVDLFYIPWFCSQGHSTNGRTLWDSTDETSRGVAEVSAERWRYFAKRNMLFLGQKINRNIEVQMFARASAALKKYHVDFFLAWW